MEKPFKKRIIVIEIKREKLQEEDVE